MTEYRCVLPRAAVRLVAVLFFLVFAVSSSFGAGLNIMKKSELKPGMKGTAKTVFKGNKISDFPVSIVGLLPGAGPGGGDLVLVRISGPLVKKTGGVALGMSGSPVYIKNKLIGAISVMFPDADHTLGGVTPIEDMLTGYDYLGKKAQSFRFSPVEIDGKSYSSIDYTGTSADEHVLNAKLALAPVAIRGLNKRSYSVMKTFFAGSGLDILPLAGGSALDIASPGSLRDYGSGKTLKPGSSVAVQLVRGDIDISVVGTVTTIDENKVLMFGHPMFTKGKVEYMLADADVLAIVNDPNAPYKLTVTKTCRGIVLQDRGSALIGYNDRFPEMIPMKVTVLDKDINREKTVNVNLVKDTDVFPNLVVAVMLNTLDKSIDRIGPGTANLTFNIETKGLDAKIERKNMFYSSFDITAESLREFMMALEIIQTNYFKDVEVTGLEARVEIDSKHNAASILDASLVEIATDTKSDEKGSASEETTDDETSASSSPAAEIGGSLAADSSDDAVADESAEDEEDITLPDILSQKDSESKGLSAKKSSKKRSSKNVPKVHPGQKLCVRVKLIPYKKEPIEEKLYLKVPSDIAEGAAIIDVFSGMKVQRTMVGLDALALDSLIEEPSNKEKGREQSGDPSSSEWGEDGKKKKNDTLEDIVKDFLDNDKNNELVATITSLSAAPRGKADTADEDGPGSPDLFSGDDEDDSQKDRAKKATQWVLTGSATIKVKVEDLSDKQTGKSGKIEKSKISTMKKNGDANGGKQQNKER